METRLEQEKLNTETKAKKPWLGVVYIVISAFCFSLMSVCVRKAGDLPTFQKAFFRNAVAAVAGFVLVAKSGSFKMQKGSLVPLLLRSIVGTVGIIGNFYAIDRMNISDASILNKLAPFFSVIFSIWILKEKASVLDLLFVGVAFGGALFVVKPSFEISDFFPALVGVVGGLGAGMAYTFVRLLSNHGERGPFIVFFFSVFSCIAILPIVIIQFQPMTWEQVVWLLLAGCAASGAQFSVTAAYAHAPAKEISVYDYSQVLFTALWGVIFFAEFPDYLSVIGYVIIIGAALAKYFFGRRKSHKEKPKK
ncbi:MAG: DMT family transporter [Clostridiales bacterium]|nr:DMT family transporter [Clostridiales bacterium]